MLPCKIMPRPPINGTRGRMAVADWATLELFWTKNGEKPHFWHMVTPKAGLDKWVLFA
jgi:hypothetical protein